MTAIRKGQAPAPLMRNAFHERFNVLLVCGASRNDGSCRGEMSKTFHLVQLALEVLRTDTAVQEEARNVARAVVAAVVELRAGRLRPPEPRFKDPRPK
jgi:hypothetical protein